MLPWWFWIVVLVLDFFLVYIGSRLGARIERSKQASREEAIRKAAYTDGCEWSADFWRKHMNQTEWNEMYQVHYTKDSS